MKRADDPILEEKIDEPTKSPKSKQKVSSEKREENDKHFFQSGFLWAHAKFRHMAKQLKNDDQMFCRIVREFLEDFHDHNFDNDDYREGYIAMEEEAEETISEYTDTIEKKKSIEEDIKVECGRVECCRFDGLDFNHIYSELEGDYLFLDIGSCSFEIFFCPFCGKESPIHDEEKKLNREGELDD